MQQPKGVESIGALIRQRRSINGCSITNDLKAHKFRAWQKLSFKERGEISIERGEISPLVRRREGARYKTKLMLHISVTALICHRN